MKTISVCANRTVGNYPYGGQKTCPCCGGSGTQIGRDGMKHICPECRGTGKIGFPFKRTDYIIWNS